MNRTRIGRRPATGIRGRLLGLVLVPALGLAGVGFDQMAEHRSLAQDAMALETEVADAAAALDAFLATTHEYRIVGIAEQAVSFGIPPEVAGEMLGLDLAAELRDVRRRIDRNPILPRVLEDAGGRAALDRARASFDRSGTGDAVFAGALVSAKQTWRDVRARAVEASAGLAEPSLRRSVDTLSRAAALFEIADEEMLVVAEAMVPGAAEGIGTPADINWLSARYDVALSELTDLADDHVRPALEPILAREGLVDSVLREHGNAGPSLDVTEIAEVFRAGLARNDVLTELIAATSADARAHARSVERAAEDRHRRTVAVVGGLLAASVVFALVVSRSISRPLRRLARRAEELSDGDLHGEALPPDGPKETATLASTLNDAVTNLRAVEQRVAALAAGDVDGARQATPGKLGALVGRSVDGLAASLTERERLQRRLAHDATHDSLTGLRNRRSGMDRLGSMLDDEGTVGLFFLDLDGFKGVNDGFGHAVGDRVLVATARRLLDAVDPESLVARLGGDEFIVATSVSGGAEARRLAEGLLAVFDDPFTVDGLPHRVGGSIGVALSQPDDDADLLLRSADIALHEAKRSSRGGVVVIDADRRAEVEEQHRIESELRVALEADELELHYQPVFGAAGGLHGAEALVRWRLREGALVAPDAFIPIAERSSLIVDVDRWVLRRALRQLAEWAGGALGDLRLSVNVSARTMLAPGFVEDVRAALADHGVDGHRLVVEVTETALLFDLDLAARQIGALLELGVRTSVDDFGTGYTSVAHLRRLPVSEVKIDRSFVQAMGLDERDRVLVDLVSRIGTVLGLDVVAEGVETAEQLVALRELGCHYAQGFLLGRPVAPDRLLAEHGAGLVTKVPVKGALDPPMGGP